MSTTNESKYGSSNQTISCGLASLASTLQVASSTVDNSSSLFLDALVSIKLKTNTLATSATGTVNVYAYGSVDGGTNYSDSVTAGGAVTLSSPPNARLLGVVNAVANSTSYVAGPWALSPCFNGLLPQQWGVVVENKTGANLGTDAGTFTVAYQGMYFQAV